MPSNLDLIDFTGGLNLQRDEFSLNETESPDMLNVELDRRGGFYTRRGWSRWNAADVVASPVTNWMPRRAWYSPGTTQSPLVYVANGSTVYSAPPNGVFQNLFVQVEASPHLADFAAWGDAVYIAAGRQKPSIRRNSTDPPVTLGVAFNDDYTTPTGGNMPQCDLIETHAGYMFVASTFEVADTYVNRIRWSHPGAPEDWHTRDFIDIELGGSRITALMSFQDHLLIFKPDSIWALYGYNNESWQLIQVSQTTGVQSPEAVSRSETAVYYYSASNRGGIFAYPGGEPIHIGEKLRPVVESIAASRKDDAWLGWVGRKLWVVLPVPPFVGASSDATTVFVFDPEIGKDGVWLRHSSAAGSLNAIVQDSDAESEYPLAAVNGSSGAACLVRLDFLEQSEDQLLETGEATPFDAYYRTAWLSIGTDTRKSWLRSRALLRKPDTFTDIRIDTYENYDPSSSKRSTNLFLVPEPRARWTVGGSADPEGFDWGDGTLWGGDMEGSDIERSTGAFGLNRALQLKFSTGAAHPGQPWGVNALFLKYNLRERTT